MNTKDIILMAVMVIFLCWNLANSLMIWYNGERIEELENDEKM